jgi:thiol:disulfide interchange protein
LIRQLLLFFILLALPLAARADDQSTVQRNITRASLVSEYTTITPGQPIHVGIVLAPEAGGWHTYWENPGDAGLATSLTWTLPDDFSASAIDWPVPQRIQEDKLVIYGYVGNVFLPVTIMPAATLDPSVSYAIKVKADWLVCENICIPESAELTLNLPVSDTSVKSASASLFADARNNQPLPLTQAIAHTASDTQRVLRLPFTNIDDKKIESAYFFPRQSHFIRYGSEQTLAMDQDDLTLTIDKSEEPLEASSIGGILAVTTQDGVRNFDVVLAPSIAPTSLSLASSKVTMTGSDLRLQILFAILGGLILNLMPCVLPVLSLKALAVVKKAGKGRWQILGQGLAYTFGILLSFLLIAALLISLQQAGEVIGWGFQMQSPPFVGFLIYLLFLVGLSLSGFFHLPVVLGNTGGDLASESSIRGSFFTGVLAAAVATPCTAPFMASAVGAALTLPPLQALLIFEALGFGLALPFLIISIIPQMLRFLPKPGAWMDTFKQFLAFPIYASVIWLLWVLTLQTGAGGMVVALTGLLVLVVLIWMKSIFASEYKYSLTAVAGFALVLLLSLPALHNMQVGSSMLMPSYDDEGVNTVDFNQTTLAELRAAGKPVFVDATAAWCITCQVNAKVAIHTKDTMRAFREHGVTLMIADWTLRNKEITEFLESFQHQGVPLYVFYPAKGEPIVLPQLLTESIVIDMVSR